MQEGYRVFLLAKGNQASKVAEGSVLSGIVWPCLVLPRLALPFLALPFLALYRIFVYGIVLSFSRLALGRGAPQSWLALRLSWRWLTSSLLALGNSVAEFRGVRRLVPWRLLSSPSWHDVLVGLRPVVVVGTRALLATHWSHAFGSPEGFLRSPFWFAAFRFSRSGWTSSLEHSSPSRFGRRLFNRFGVWLLPLSLVLSALTLRLLASSLSSVVSLLSVFVLSLSFKTVNYTCLLGTGSLLVSQFPPFSPSFVSTRTKSRATMPTSRQSGVRGISTHGGPTKFWLKLRRSLTREARDRSAFVRLRSVAPERRSRRRDRMPKHAFTAEEKDLALHALQRDMFAKTTWKSIASMHRTIDRLLRCFDLELMPFRTIGVCSGCGFEDLSISFG